MTMYILSLFVVDDDLLDGGTAVGAAVGGFWMAIPLVVVLDTTAFDVTFAFKFFEVEVSCLVKSPDWTEVVSFCCSLVNRLTTLEVFDGVTAANRERGICTFMFAETDCANRSI